ncbi:hypothetical protein [Thermomonospora amylolytica]|uniref:hypothetical protein n=1 Tax=Thermomonospora amylolytica TaxID=1411117 RepID=UPI0013005AF2|nr:hypothetical protein [Thermomonospora amylolytica]
MATSEPYFSHMPLTSSDGDVLQHPTRYMCAAAYLDETFARKLTKEFVEEDHRGVVPSFGFDLVPVVRHALRARRMRLVRDTVLTVAILLGLLLNFQATLVVLAAFLMVGLFLALNGALARTDGPMAARPVRIAFMVGLVVVFPFLLLSFTGALAGGSGDYYGDYSGGLDGDGLPEADGGGKAALAGLLVLGAMIVAPFGYRYMVYQTLRKLGPGSAEVAPEPVGDRVRTTLRRIAAAQRGNITLYSRENPFLGSGDIGSRWARAWSIALELDRTAAEPLGDGREDRTPGDVDPVELHRHVHERLIAMRDEPPANERIGGLMVDWHVVAQGECVQADRPVEPTGEGPLYRDGHPLIDRQAAVPYSHAGPRAIEAIIRHPQADIRCYQRVTVATQGQAIRDGDGRIIAPARYEDTMLSAFLYLAVEGRMLYAQFVVNVIPPIREEFRIVDDLPAYTDGMMFLRVLREGGLRALGEGILGPFRMSRALGGLVSEALRAQSGRAPTSFVRYDYGARISAREEAAERGFRTFMQTLDADKYTNLIERRINEAVLDYLQSHDVDVTAYREQAAFVLNNPFIMSGGSISGSQIAVGGAGSRIMQQQSRPQS